MGEWFSSSATPTVKGEPLSFKARSLYSSSVQVASCSGMIELSGSDKPPRKNIIRHISSSSGVPVPESLQHIPQWTLYLGGVTSSLLLDSSLAKSSVMTGQRRVDPSAVRYLIGRIKQAKVSGQKQEYQRQGRDVNNTRQKSGSQAQVQSSKVRQSGVKHRDNK